MNIIVYTENIMKKPLSLKVDDEQLQVDVYFFFFIQTMYYNISLDNN